MASAARKTAKRAARTARTARCAAVFQRRVAARAAADQHEHQHDLTRCVVGSTRRCPGETLSSAALSGEDAGAKSAQEFVSVFETAGWDHHGAAGVTTQEWPRDPVGVEVVLNEDDARGDKIPPGVAGPGTASSTGSSRRARPRETARTP
mgnify:CR=1 FL=1